ncbi:MAG: aminoacyl-tRNA hydrolase [Gemmatimonadetes bacterium]|nr:aminoacyl-tRNA hydrolase [Gemmatimonadota bacterium]
MKVICGLGNPGAEYEATRHNVGWWAVEEAQATWRFPEFLRLGNAWRSTGSVGAHEVLLVEPLTFMNRSGSVLAGLARRDDFDFTRDLLVVVDDTALDVGRVRLRSEGSAGGHNGLKSVEAALGTRQYARLRIGVGTPPPGADLADWVLSPFEERDERLIIELLPAIVDAMTVWVAEGVDAAANQVNR